MLRKLFVLSSFMKLGPELFSNYSCKDSKVLETKFVNFKEHAQNLSE